MTTVVLTAAILVGLYMAWNIGANDVANAFGTSVGSGVLTLRKAVVLAAIFEFGGAFCVGGSVAQTIRKGIVRHEALGGAARAAASGPASGATAPSGPARAIATAPAARPAWRLDPADVLRTRIVLGMLAALAGASLWLNVATYFGQPVSTTHAIIGGVVGFAIVAAGPGAVQWGMAARIVASWVISPVAGAALAFIIYRCIHRLVLEHRHPVFRAQQAVPLGYAAVAFILALSSIREIFHLRLDPLELGWAVLGAAGIAAVTALVVRAVLRWRKIRYRRRNRYQVVERWFGWMQVTTACYMSFAHGANDVANSVGPLAAVLHLVAGGEIDSPSPVPPWLLALGGLGIVVGLATYGYKVIESIGKKITEVTPTRGFSAEFGTATTVLACSIMGLPISTTFVLVGAVMGVGLARGFAAIDLKVIRRIFTSWIITIPASALIASALYWAAMRLVG